jgi:hypothetical protein
MEAVVMVVLGHPLSVLVGVAVVEVVALKKKNRRNIVLQVIQFLCSKSVYNFYVFGRCV